MTAAALRDAERVLVLGCPGAGKTVFSTRLGALLGLPVRELDELYFGPGWTTSGPEEWRSTVRALCAGDRWIIDGNHASTVADRLERAQAVVLFDRAPVLCLASYLRRALGLATGPYEALPQHMRLPGGRRRVVDRPVRFARFILGFRRRTLAQVASVLAEHRHVPVLRLRGRAQAARLLADLGERATC